MKWKKRPSGVFLFLTLLHCALCNHHSHDKHGKGRKHEDPLSRQDITDVTKHAAPEIPGLPISQLEDLSFLDPYNLIDGKSFTSEDKASILHEIIPMGKSGNVYNKNKKGRTSRKDSDTNTSKYSVVGNLKDPEKSTSLSSQYILSLHRPNLGRKLPKVTEKDEDKSGKDRSKSEKDEDTLDTFGTLDYDDMHDFGKVADDVEKDSSPNHRKKSAYTRIEEDRNALLHEAVRKLLGFSSSPDPQDERGRLLPDPTREKRLPRYVKDLYERFQSGEMSAGLVNGNTVRSIHTNIGMVEGEFMFLFNLSSLRPSEELLNAEIHLFKRKLRPRVRRIDVEVILYQIAPHYISEAGKITIRDTASGWQWYDVTSAVKSCLATRDPRPHLFGLSFRAQKSNGKTRTLPLRKFGRHHSMPFLVVYSNETEAVNFDQLDLLAERLRLRNDQRDKQTTDQGKDVVDEEDNDDVDNDDDDDDDDDDLDDGNIVPYDLEEGGASEEEPELNSEDKDESILSNKKYNIDNHEPQDPMEIVIAPLPDPDEPRGRQKRSIYTNEIPEDPADFEKYKYQRYKIPKTHPGILKARKESRIQISNGGVIPFPEHHLQQRRRRRKNRKRKHRRRFPSGSRRLHFPKEWDNYEDSFVAKDKAVDSSNVCGKKKLVVDFADIGWGDWIISPKSFEAHYCAGECPFPLTKRLRPSNHATIQSIVHAIGIYDKVPAPCCVPDVMSSVTLLYFDEDRNVVLKNYPGMTVESCACR